MKNRTTSLLLAGLLVVAGSAQANTVTLSGTLFKQAGGTTFDSWNINLLTAGSFTVNVKAYEASQSNIATAGYFANDINGDGELTWLDPDTYFYRNDGHLDAVDALVRCDDIANNCAVYQNGLTAATSPVTVNTLSQAEGAADGSIHFRRDPAYSVTAAAGNYLFLLADFRLDAAEAAGGINTNDNFSAPTNFASPNLDHADYSFSLSSDTLHFAVNGNTINVTSVPVPAAVWLFGTGLMGLLATGRGKQAVKA